MFFTYEYVFEHQKSMQLILKSDPIVNFCGAPLVPLWPAPERSILVVVIFSKLFWVSSCAFCTYRVQFDTFNEMRSVKL